MIKPCRLIGYFRPVSDLMTASAALHAGIGVGEIDAEGICHSFNDAVAGEGRAGDGGDVHALRIKDLGNNGALGAVEILAVVLIGDDFDGGNDSVLYGHGNFCRAAEAGAGSRVGSVRILAGRLRSIRGTSGCRRCIRCGRRVLSCGRGISSSCGRTVRRGRSAAGGCGRTAGDGAGSSGIC